MWKFRSSWTYRCFNWVFKSKSFKAKDQLHLQSSKGLLGYLDLGIRGQSHVLKCLDPINQYSSILYILLTVHLGIIFVNIQLDARFFSIYVYFYSLHVSGSHVPIIRRINSINTTSGICHSVQMTVWCTHQTVIYKEWHIPDVVLIQFSWWWAHIYPKHVENRNKHTWKRIVRQVGSLQRQYSSVISQK
jgi:hypothetical protein